MKLEAACLFLGPRPANVISAPPYWSEQITSPVQVQEPGEHRTVETCAAVTSRKGTYPEMGRICDYNPNSVKTVAQQRVTGAPALQTRSALHGS